MALADYQPARALVEFKGGSVSVRGLSLDDVAVLVGHHLEDLDKLMAMYQDHVRQDVAVAASVQYAIALAKDAPGLVAHVIALASDEPNQVDQARLLPMPVQVDILKSIGHLTFDQAGGAGKFGESLLSLLGRMAPKPTKTDSPT